MKETREGEEPTEAPPDQPKRGSLALLIWSCILLPVLYVLSIGPVYRFLPLHSSIIGLYTPLLSCAYKCPPLMNALTWYTKHVWGVSIFID